MVRECVVKVPTNPTAVGRQFVIGPFWSFTILYFNFNAIPMISLRTNAMEDYLHIDECSWPRAPSKMTLAKRRCVTGKVSESYRTTLSRLLFSSAASAFSGLGRLPGTVGVFKHHQFVGGEPFVVSPTRPELN
jgi:hypothetical protein